MLFKVVYNAFCLAFIAILPAVWCEVLCVV